MHVLEDLCLLVHNVTQQYRNGNTICGVLFMQALLQVVLSVYMLVYVMYNANFSGAKEQLLTLTWSRSEL